MIKLITAPAATLRDTLTEAVIALSEVI